MNPVSPAEGADDPTPYPELNEVLQEFVDGVQDALGRSFVSACLQGSFAVGDFDRWSDVDFIVAVEDELSGVQVAALQALHERIHSLACPWAQHLEGSYFPVEVLRDFTRRGTPLWYIDNGSRVLERSDHCNTILVRWVVREHGVRLAGAEPPALVDPISASALRREILDVINDWGAELLTDPGRFSNRFYQTFIVLNYCRMLHDLRNGYPGSKRAGAEWAVPRLGPEWGAFIEKAWRDRRHPMNRVRYPADPEEMRRTLEFVRVICCKANRFAAETGLTGAG